MPANKTTSTTSETFKIVVGKTKFQYHYADSVSEWTVVKSRVAGHYDCEIRSGEWSGTKKVFSKAEILSIIAQANIFKASLKKSDSFYGNLKVGQIVHYHNSGNSFVRCKVVFENGENCLMPIAVVGSWGTYDLPNRRRNGSISYGYYAEKIMKGETFHPHESCIYEANPKRCSNDPRNMKPIDLTVPEMTPEEKVVASYWKQIEFIDDICRESNINNVNPLDFLKRIKDAAEESLSKANHGNQSV